MTATTALVPRRTLNHIANVFMAFGNADQEIRMINIYRRELLIAQSTTVPIHVRRVSAEVCADIVGWLGFTPDSLPTQETSDTDAGASGVRG